LKEILERQLIMYPKWGCCNIFCNCGSSRRPRPHAASGPYAMQAWCINRE